MNTERISLYISNFLRFTIIIAIFVAFFEKFWMSMFISILILFTTFLPAIIERNYKINLPVELEFLLIFFLYASLFLGEMNSFYNRYWWWDIFLHVFSGILLGIIGFITIFILNKEKNVKLYMSTGFVTFFSFTFALSMGAIWEIFEFFMDQIFGFNMQKTGLVDTMGDLIVDSIGALLASIAGYFYMRKVTFSIFDRIIKRFKETNPNLFKTKKERRK